MTFTKEKFSSYASSGNAHIFLSIRFDMVVNKPWSLINIKKYHSFLENQNPISFNQGDLKEQYIFILI